MSTHPSHANLPENNFHPNSFHPGPISPHFIPSLSPKDVEDFFDLRLEIGKSVSAPPISFPQLVFSPPLKVQTSEVPESFALDNYNDHQRSTGPLMSYLSQRHHMLSRSTSFEPSQTLEEELFNQQQQNKYTGLQPLPFIQNVQRSYSQNYQQPHNIQPTHNTPFYQYNPNNRTSPESPLRSPTHPPHQENYYPNNNYGQVSPYQQWSQENLELEENFFLNPQQNSFGYNHPNYNNINRAGSTDPYQFARENPNMFQSHQFDNNNRKPSYPPMNNGFWNPNYSQENTSYSNSRKSTKDKEPYSSGGNGSRRSSKYSSNSKGSSPFNTHQMPYQRENAHPNAKNYQGGQKTRQKSNSGGYANIQQMLANVVEASKDQNGSRIIQQYFEAANREERDMIFQQVMDHSNILLTDMFGNYVIQKILQLGTLHQKLKIYEIMKGRIFALSQHMYSCRIVQKALEEFSNNGLIQDQILKELDADILSLIQNQNGNHVVQKCFETIPSEKLRFIIDKVTENIDKLSFHAFECRIIQKILEFSTFEQVSELLKRIMERCFECCQSQYGNYVMQHVLEKGSSVEKDKLLEVLSNNFVKLSLDKFASNVTEKSIIHSNAEYRRQIVEVLIHSNYEEKLSLLVLINDQYGNYVIQRLFEYSDKAVRRVIYDTIMSKEHFEDARKTGFGQHVSSHIEKLMNIQKI